MGNNNTHPHKAPQPPPRIPNGTNDPTSIFYTGSATTRTNHMDQQTQQRQASNVPGGTRVVHTIVGDVLAPTGPMSFEDRLKWSFHTVNNALETNLPVVSNIKGFVDTAKTDIKSGAEIVGIIIALGIFYLFMHPSQARHLADTAESAFSTVASDIGSTVKFVGNTAKKAAPLVLL